MFFKIALPLVLAAGIGGPFAMKHGMQVDGPCGGSAFKGHGLMVQKLGITDVQKTSFKQAVDRHKPALAAKAQLFFDARSALLDAGLDPTNTTDSLRPLQQRTAEMGFELAKEVRSIYLELLPHLTESQKAKAKMGFEMIRSKMGQGLGEEQGHRHGMMMHLMGARLDLSDAQKQAVESIHVAHKPAIEAKKEAFHGLIMTAVDAGLDPNTTEDALRQNQQKVAEAAFALATEVRGAYLESLPVLSEAQRVKGREFLSQLRTHKEGLRKVMLGF
ncbi:MAG: hypothetical protein IPP78_02235 [Holophagaceae bacterium]|nr:hypothetical protein [Holophagaceae bacterium]